MEKYTKKVLVYIDDELDKWMQGKAERGYKKGAFVRHILEQKMRFEQQKKEEVKAC